MSRSQIKLVISDFHLGAGATLPNGDMNYLEDFFYDGKLAEFLDYHSSGDYARADVELVANGDFFNHLQIYPDEKNPALMTEDVTRWRTERIIAGHPLVFDAMARFAAVPRHRITFMIGNHDIGLLWPSVEEILKTRLGAGVRVHRDPVLVEDGVWIEHGNQFMAENRIDFEKPFISNGKDAPVISMPWGELFVIRYLNKVKRKRRYVDKVYPFGLYLKWALIHDTIFAVKAALMGIAYFMAVALRIGENSRFARQEFVRILKEFSFPVRMDRAAKRVFALHPDIRIVVFGHGHKATAKAFGGGRKYFNTGIWNEMISLDIGTMGRQLKLTYVEISFDRDGIPEGGLKEWKGMYREVEDIPII